MVGADGSAARPGSVTLCDGSAWHWHCLPVAGSASDVRVADFGTATQVAEGVCKHIKDTFKSRVGAPADKLFAWMTGQGKAQPRSPELRWPSGGIFAPKTSGGEEQTVARLLPALIGAALAHPKSDARDLFDDKDVALNSAFRRPGSEVREVLLEALQHYSRLFRIARLFGLQEIREVDLQRYTQDVEALLEALDKKWPHGKTTRGDKIPGVGDGPWGDIPKFHALLHVPHFVRRFGRCSNFDTQIAEHNHKCFAKLPAARMGSKGSNPMRMAAIIEVQEEMIDADLRRRGTEDDGGESDNEGGCRLRGLKKGQLRDLGVLLEQVGVVNSATFNQCCLDFLTSSVCRSQDAQTKEWKANRLRKGLEPAGSGGGKAAVYNSYKVRGRKGEVWARADVARKTHNVVHVSWGQNGETAQAGLAALFRTNFGEDAFQEEVCALVRWCRKVEASERKHALKEVGLTETTAALLAEHMPYSLQKFLPGGGTWECAEGAWQIVTAASITGVVQVAFVGPVSPGAPPSVVRPEVKYLWDIGAR